MSDYASIMAKITERHVETFCKLEDLQSKQADYQKQMTADLNKKLSSMILTQSWFPLIFGIASANLLIGSAILKTDRPILSRAFKMGGEQGIPGIAKATDSRFESTQVQRRGSIEISKLNQEDAKRYQQAATDALNALIRTTNEAYSAERSELAAL